MSIRPDGGRCLQRGQSIAWREVLEDGSQPLGCHFDRFQTGWMEEWCGGEGEQEGLEIAREDIVRERMGGRRSMMKQLAVAGAVDRGPRPNCAAATRKDPDPPIQVWSCMCGGTTGDVGRPGGSYINSRPRVHSLGRGTLTLRQSEVNTPGGDPVGGTSRL